ncbi:hypothetical protein BH20ACI1_BH20ACI1_19390 [soil metagenome]
MSENTISENENAAGQTKAPTETTAPTETGTSEAEATKTAETEAVATSAIIKIEGQEFPLDVAIAADNELLKTALSPHYPSIKNAAITRETRAGQMIVSIVKKAEHKGAVRK